MITLEIEPQAFIEALRMILLLTLLVFADTFTKWFLIITKYNTEHNFKNTPLNILRGIFFRAWQEGYLESGIFRNDLGKKALVYYTNVAVALTIVVLMPDYKFQGLQADETIAFFIYLAMVLAECFSIAENFKEMGAIQGNWIALALKAVLVKFGIQEPKESDKKCDK